MLQTPYKSNHQTLYIIIWELLWIVNFTKKNAIKASSKAIDKSKENIKIDEYEGKIGVFEK